MRVDGETQRVDELLALAHHTRVVHYARARIFFAHEDILRYGEVGAKVEFLVNEGDALGAGFFGIAKVLFLALNYHLACVMGNFAGKDFHQSGLSGTIFTQKDIDFAFIEVEPHIIEDQDICSANGLTADVEDILFDTRHIQYFPLHYPWLLLLLMLSINTARRMMTPSTGW